MAEITDSIKLLNEEIEILIYKAHKSLNYWQILKVFMRWCSDLIRESEVEYYLKQGKYE